MEAIVSRLEAMAIFAWLRGTSSEASADFYRHMATVIALGPDHLVTLSMSKKALAILDRYTNTWILMFVCICLQAIALRLEAIPIRLEAAKGCSVYCS